MSCLSFALASRNPADYDVASGSGDKSLILGRSVIKRSILGVFSWTIIVMFTAIFIALFGGQVFLFTNQIEKFFRVFEKNP